MDRMSSHRSLRIALLAPPMLAVPPPSYAGTERVIATLGDALLDLGHDVTLFASGDSTFRGRLVPVIEQSVWSTGYRGDVSSFITMAIATAWEHHAEFDVIHSHVEGLGFLFARHCGTPVVSTLHGRLDRDGMYELLDAFSDIPLVAISESQRRWHPDGNWLATIHHGLPLAQMPSRDEPGDYLAFVGRIAPEKGVEDAIELARRVHLPLRMAAKVYDSSEQELYDQVVAPAVEEDVVEFLGEVGELERDPLLAGALATLMLGAWPEPFGLVAIESMATGTPVIARRAGALTETIEHGRDGFLVDDLSEAELAVDRVRELDRHAIRASAIERFSPERMARDYVAVYEQLIDGSAGEAHGGDVASEPEASAAPVAAAG